MIILGILLCVCGLYTWGIPAIINIKSHKEFIENKIYEASGYRIDIGNPELSMGFFPSIWIKSDNISLLNNDNSKALFIKHPKLKLKLLPLLRKKIEISHLTAEQEDAYVVYSEDSQFLIGQYPIRLPEQKGAYTLSKMDLKLGNYNIYLNDLKNNEKLSLQGKYFKHGKYVHNKHLKFATKGAFSAGDRSTDIYADIDINLPIDRISEDKLRIYAKLNGFDLSSISNYISTLTNGKITSLYGVVNLNADTRADDFGHKKISINLDTTNLSIMGEDNASSIIYKDKLGANINFSTVENGLLFNNMTLKSDRINLLANGKLYDIGHKNIKYDITASVKDTRIEDVVAILPGSETLLPDFNLYKLKKYVFYGDGEGKLTFKGQGNRPNVKGYVKLRDAYLIHTIKGAPANAKVDLNFTGNRMLLDVYVPAGINQDVTVKGNVLIDGSKYSELDIKSSDAVSLAPAQEILNPLHEILKFQLGPVPMMSIAGIGNISLRSAGKKVDPHIWGEIHFKNGTASFTEINNLVLYNGAGDVLFDDTKVTFKTTQGIINNRPVEIKGDCSVLGKLNVYVNSKGQDVQKLIKTINSSPILIDVQKVVKPFTHPEGIADVFLYIYGTAKNAEEVVFNEDLFAKGTITLHHSKTIMQDTFLPFTNVNGVVNFDQYDSDYDVSGDVRKSHVHVWGTGTNNEIDLKAHSDNFEINDIFDMLHPDMLLPFKKDIGKIHASFDASYKGTVENGYIDYNKIKVGGKFLSNMTSSTDLIKQNGGTFTMNNGLLKTSTFNGLFNNNPYTLSFTSKDLDKEEMNISEAKFNFKNFDLSAINAIKHQIKLPKNTEILVNNISDIRGKVDIDGSIKNNSISADTNLSNISFEYTPLNALVKVLNGRANISGNVLYLDKINTQVSSMPLFVDGKISNIYNDNPRLNLFVSSKLTQQFFDRFFNSKTVYPIKVKGDVNFYTKLDGTQNMLGAKSTLNLAENASIYYMGATLAGAPTGNINTEGMTTNPVTVISDVILYPDKIKVNSLKYNQVIASQNKRKSVQNQITSSGEIKLLKDNVLAFKNFKIKTENPTNARLFNVLFKKPTIKQGVFMADMVINGTSEFPYAVGYLNIKSIDIPLLDATVKDINVDFQKDYIYLDTVGVVLTSDILMQAKILNKPTKPVEVENLLVQMDELNLNTIITAMSDIEADNTRISKLKSGENAQIFSDTLVIKNAEINADNILIKKARATGFKTHFTIDNNQLLNIDNYKFNIANGIVDGSIQYNLHDLDGSANMNINNADASIIAENFFDMHGQMYGTVTGKLNASCSGVTGVECVNTLSGEGNFEVQDGRMPKLGSLEYLLKAGNLITSGVTGVSINGIIDLITPLKTGSFSKISGDIHVKDGIADNINVYSSGKDLNLYMTGSYNLSTLVADMEIYGSLSKNFSTILGKISNASLNTLFNTIPGIKINEINPKSTSNILNIPNFDRENVLRVFKAEIFGDINGSNYVKSFRWIKD